MEQLVILLVIGAISLVNWLMQRSAELREKRKLESGPPPPAAKHGSPAPVATDSAEAMRTLMEALGLPVEEPPPQLPRRELPIPSEQPTSRTLPIPANRPVPAPPALPQAVTIERRIFGEQKPIASRPAARVPSIAAKVAVRPKNRFHKILTGRRSVRDAIVLSEILALPKGLRGE